MQTNNDASASGATAAAGGSKATAPPQLSDQEYIERHLDPVFRPLIEDMSKKMPQNPTEFILDYVRYPLPREGEDPPVQFREPEDLVTYLDRCRRASSRPTGLKASQAWSAANDDDDECEIEEGNDVE